MALRLKINKYSLSVCHDSARPCLVPSSLHPLIGASNSQIISLAFHSFTVHSHSKPQTMDRRRDARYKQQEPHHYDDRYATYDNYDYEEDYGNQYANTVSHHNHSHPHVHPHRQEDHGYCDEEDHWLNQREQQDFYDTVPATNVPPVKLMGPPKNLARVQISTSMDPDSSSIPQAPPPPRFGPTGGYNNHSNNNNDRKPPVSKYGDMATTDIKQRRESADLHIRFEPGTKRDFPSKQAPFIDGFRNGESVTAAAKKKEAGGATSLQATKTNVRSIINNLKGGGNEKHEDTVPRNRVSTNPFMRANQQQQQPQQQQNLQNHNSNKFEHKSISKNVAEVVEKMNNGDWPIQIDDEDSSPPLSINDAKRGYQHPDKARQWETLHRKKDEKRSILEENSLPAAPPPPPPLPTQLFLPPQAQLKQQHPQMQVQQEPNGKVPDSNYEEEHTSVSTDSALCSDSSETRGPSPYKLPLDSQNPGELSDEAEKLLFYFKTHKEVLNYLGIGLTDRIWNHIQKLPNFESSIRVFKKQEETVPKPLPAPSLNQNSSALSQPSNVPPVPKIAVSQSFAQPDRDRKSPNGHSQNRSVSQNEESFSPNNGFCLEENRFIKNSENGAGNNRDKSNNGGRFVKKSAAALIAKKQGMQTEDPNSATEIIDPRIAEEIKNLRDREEELKKTRSELVLQTSPRPSSYQMSPNPNKTSPGSKMRSAQSYDHLDSSIKSPIERSHSSHNVYHLKSPLNRVGSPDHHGYSYGNTNYGSMPRAQHRKEGSYHTQVHEHRSHDGGYRQSRKGDFFRPKPTASEATNAGWQKSATSFEAKSSVPVHSGLQLPAASISISANQQRSNDKYQNPKSMYSSKQHDTHRKVGL